MQAPVHAGTRACRHPCVQAPVRAGTCACNLGGLQRRGRDAKQGKGSGKKRSAGDRRQKGVEDDFAGSLSIHTQLPMPASTPRQVERHAVDGLLTLVPSPSTPSSPCPRPHHARSSATRSTAC
eukprot:365344-Chlamydomonas_euryale.AAC.4